MGRAAPPRGIAQGEVTGRPTLPPPPDLSPRQADPLPGHFVGQGRVLVQEQDQLGALHGLMERRAATNLPTGQLHKLIRKSRTERGSRSGHAMPPILEQQMGGAAGDRL